MLCRSGNLLVALGGRKHNYKWSFGNNKFHMNQAGRSQDNFLWTKLLDDWHSPSAGTSRAEAAPPFGHTAQQCVWGWAMKVAPCSSTPLRCEPEKPAAATPGRNNHHRKSSSWWSWKIYGSLPWCCPWLLAGVDQGPRQKLFKSLQQQWKYQHTIHVQ